MEPEKQKSLSSRMCVENITRGRIEQPLRVILYGPPKIGKSTFGSKAPAPIFLGAAKETANLDVGRFPVPEKWEDVFEAINELGTKDTGYKTLVIDTLDWLEPLCHKYVIDEENNSNRKGKEKITDIDGFGYGRGYDVALAQWRKLIVFFERLCDKRGTNIILLAHSQIQTFKNPKGPDYERYTMILNKKAAGLFQQWADEILFADYDTETTKDKNGRVRGIDSGQRVIHTVQNAAWVAGNRRNLPDILPLEWSDYEAAAKLGEPASSAEIVSAIENLLASCDEDLVAKIKTSIEKAGNNSEKLSQILNRVKVLTTKENE